MTIGCNSVIIICYKTHVNREMGGGERGREVGEGDAGEEERKLKGRRG